LSRAPHPTEGQGFATGVLKHVTDPDGKTLQAKVIAHDDGGTGVPKHHAPSANERRLSEII
jgi:hypothetical protein